MDMVWMTIPAVQTAKAKTGEWEYEEVTDDAVAEGEEGQDWEWEYEEVPADAAAEGEEGEDWEWEYEEVTDEEDFAAEPELRPLLSQQRWKRQRRRQNSSKNQKLFLTKCRNLSA